MIFGIGIDILEVKRMDEMISRGETYLETIFTPAEREYCRGKASSSGYFAARFTAKEAFKKALGTNVRNGLHLTEIEVARDGFGKPSFSFHGYVKELCERLGIKTASLSISHVRQLAIALVVLEN